jgi:hypothetical protein
VGGGRLYLNAEGYSLNFGVDGATAPGWNSMTTVGCALTLNLLPSATAPATKPKAAAAYSPRVLNTALRSEARLHQGSLQGLGEIAASTAVHDGGGGWGHGWGEVNLRHQRAPTQKSRMISQGATHLCDQSRYHHHRQMLLLRLRRPRRRHLSPLPPVATESYTRVA